MVQTRCLVFAKLGCVVFSPRQQHYEDLALGISHQTVSVWSNIRALDYLESRGDVDPSRIGVCGASGGGLQTQMVCAVDPRPAAAVIVGMTCEFREILFPYAAHCACNHFPGVRRFAEANFPAIRDLYEANGAGGRVSAAYEPTEHTYDRSKRERTYRWMETWLRGEEPPERTIEPAELETFAPQELEELSLDLPGRNAFERVSRIFERERCPEPPRFASREAWERWRSGMASGLGEILGEDAVLARPDADAARVRVA
ncbi:MAG: alpha/beta hydrolase family protein, partial [Planctomycetota bacterium]